MTSALPAIILTLFLSATSLVVVFFRVSPLTAPEYALPFFFASLFLLAGSSTTLLLILIRNLSLRPPLRGVRSLLRSHEANPEQTHEEHQTTQTPSMRRWQIVGVSLRQGVLIASATCIVVFLFLLRILNWWIVMLVYAVFILIEMAVVSSRP